MTLKIPYIADYYEVYHSTIQVHYRRPGADPRICSIDRETLYNLAESFDAMYAGTEFDIPTLTEAVDLFIYDEGLEANDIEYFFALKTLFKVFYDIVNEWVTDGTTEEQFWPELGKYDLWGW